MMLACIQLGKVEGKIIFKRERERGWELGGDETRVQACITDAVV